MKKIICLSFFFFYISVIQLFATINSDSLKRELNKLPDDTTKIAILNKFIIENYTKDPLLSKEMSDQAIELCNKLNSNDNLWTCYSHRAILEEFVGNKANAIDFYSKALELAEKLKNETKKFNTFVGIGNIYFYSSDFPKAMDFFLKAMEIAEKAEDAKLLGNIYFNIGNIHQEQKAYAKAMSYFSKALENFLKLGKNQQIVLCYNNMGSVKRATGDYQAALDFYNKALYVAKTDDNQRYLSMLYNNIGTLYKGIGNLDSTKYYYEKALAIKLKINDKRGMIQSFINLSKILRENQNIEGSYGYLLNALEIAKQLDDIASQKEIFKELSMIFALKNQYQHAYEYQKLVMILNDSIFNSEKLKLTNDLENKYSFEKKENEIKLQKAELEKQDLIISKQKYLFIIGLGFSLLIIFAITLGYFLQRKNNRTLTESNRIINRQKDELEVQSKKLSHVNKELEKLSIVASETNNSVMIFSPDGQLEWVNEGFVKLTGLTMTEFCSRHGCNIFEMSSNPDVKKIVEKCISQKRAVSYISTVDNSCGLKIWVQTTLTPTLLPNGNINKLVAIDSDITRIKQAEEEIQKQSEILEVTNKELEKRNTQITNSIKYAKNIQDSILPGEKTLKSFFKDSFVVFKPRDIVSGDFYWISKQGNFLFIAVVDCTGHGVPGAFMSMIGNTLLNQIVNEKEIYSPSAILQALHEGVLYTLGQSDQSTQDDGMEISLCNIDIENKILKVASTNQPVFIVSGETFTECDINIFTIGTKLFNSDKISFKEQQYDLTDNTIIYMSSDGLYDQFGEPDNEPGLKKYSKQRFVDAIHQIKTLPFENQKQMLSDDFENWKKGNKQIDDVTILGILV